MLHYNDIGRSTRSTLLPTSVGQLVLDSINRDLQINERLVIINSSSSCSQNLLPTLASQPVLCYCSHRQANYALLPPAALIQPAPNYNPCLQVYRHYATANIGRSTGGMLQPTFADQLALCYKHHLQVK